MYGITTRDQNMRPVWLTSEQIVARLDAADIEQASHIARIMDLEARGCRYANEDFDVLSSALRSAA